MRRDSKGWLREEAGKLDLGEGTSLQVVENRDLPRGQKVLIWVAGSNADAGTILKRLDLQSPSLKVGDWRLLQHEKLQNEEQLVVLMKDSSVAELQRVNLKPFFGLRRVTCVVLEKPKYGEARQEAQATEPMGAEREKE